MTSIKYISGSLTLVNREHIGKNVHMPSNTTIMCKLSFTHGKMYSYTQYYVEVIPNDENDICRGYFTLDNDAYERHALKFHENKMCFNFFAREAYGPMFACEGDTSTYECEFMIDSSSKQLYEELRKKMFYTPLSEEEKKEIENIVSRWIDNLSKNKHEVIFTWSDIMKYGNFLQNCTLKDVVKNEYINYFCHMFADFASGHTFENITHFVQNFIEEKCMFRARSSGYDEIVRYLSHTIIDHSLTDEEKQELYAEQRNY